VRSLSGDDLSRYLNKIESVGLRKYPLSYKESDVWVRNILQSLIYNMAEKQLA